MRNFRFIILGILSAIAVYFGIGFLLPQSYSIETSVEMQCPVKEVFEQVNMLENWKLWAFNKEEKELPIQFSGAVKGEGAIYEWVNVSSDGRVEILESSNESHIKIKSLAMQGTQQTSMIFSFIQQKEMVSVSWQQEGDLGDNIKMRYLNVFGLLEKAIQQDMKNRLNRLKGFCE